MSDENQETSQINIVGQNVFVGESHHVHAQQPGLGDQQSKDVRLQKAADEVKKHQLDKLNDELVFRGFDINQTSVPIIHPPLMDRYKQCIFDFDKLLTDVKKMKFLALIGPPGCGKTTMSKRLVMSGKYFMLFMRCTDLGYKFQLTLRQLLIDFPFKDVDKEIRDDAFEWMTKNQGKCVIVFDGYDQADWSLNKEKPLEASYDTPLSVQQLVANLCCKKFLSKAVIIFTTRPHSILSLPSELQPENKVDIRPLSTENIKNLLQLLAGEKFEELWKTLTLNSPQLLDFCHNPLYLQLIVYAGLFGGMDKLISLTQAFQAVLDGLKYSDHTKGYDLKDLVRPLGKVAYDGMVSESAVFTAADLAKEGLKDVHVQDFLVKAIGNVFFPTRKLFEGDSVFRFTHQPFQDIFAATYISKFLPHEEFSQIVPTVVQEDHWSMVRRFLCGLLLSNSNEGDFITPATSQIPHCSTSTMQSSGKAQNFFHELCKYKNDAHLKGVLEDLKECSEDVIDTYIRIMPQKTDFEFNSSSFKDEARMLFWVTKTVDEIKLNGELGPEKMQILCQRIGRLSCQIKDVCLSGGQISNYDATILSPSVPFITILHLTECGILARGVKALAEKVPKVQCQLKLLDLSDNPFGNEGMEFASIFLGISSMERLKVKNCGITAPGMVHLSNGLQKIKPPKQVSLELCKNNIGDDGVKHLAPSLDKLKVFHLSHCGIEKQGAHGFCKGLRRMDHNHQMEILNLSYNKLEDDGARFLHACLDKAKEFWLRDCDFTEAGKRELLDEEKRQRLPRSIVLGLY